MQKTHYIIISKDGRSIWQRPFTNQHEAFAALNKIQKNEKGYHVEARTTHIKND